MITIISSHLRQNYAPRIGAQFPKQLLIATIIYTMRKFQATAYRNLVAASSATPE